VNGLDREAIKEILPHREPMLLIDKTELVDGIATSQYTIQGDEFFLQGHFPGNPIVPGVILCEMMAQSSCLLVNAEGKKFTPFFTGLKNVRFRIKVRPGDTVTFKSQMKAQKGSFYFVKSEGFVGDKLALSGELSFAIVLEE